MVMKVRLLTTQYLVCGTSRCISSSHILECASSSTNICRGQVTEIQGTSVKTNEILVSNDASRGSLVEGYLKWWVITTSQHGKCIVMTIASMVMVLGSTLASVCFMFRHQFSDAVARAFACFH